MRNNTVTLTDTLLAVHIETTNPPPRPPAPAPPRGALP